MKTVHNKQRFQCKICEKCYGRSDSLRSHIDERHRTPQVNVIEHSQAQEQTISRGQLLHERFRYSQNEHRRNSDQFLADYSKRIPDELSHMSSVTRSADNSGRNYTPNNAQCPPYRQHHMMSSNVTEMTKNLPLSSEEFKRISETSVDAEQR